MRLSPRIWFVIASALTCLLLCAAFIGTASAQNVKPHISVTPHHVFTDSSGCASVKLAGTGFIHSNSQLHNLADLTATDSNGLATITPSTAPVDANGRFSQVETICNPGAGFPNDVFTICANDNFSGLPSNCVNVRAD